MSDAEESSRRHDEHNAHAHSAYIPVVHGSGQIRRKKKVDVSTLAMRVKKKNDDDFLDKIMAVESAEEEDSE